MHLSPHFKARYRPRWISPSALSVLLVCVLAIPSHGAAQVPGSSSSQGLSETRTQLNLPQLMALALASHPALRSQQALLGAAEAAVESARWQYYPTPSLSVQAAGVTQGDTQYGGDRNVSVLSLSQPLWTWGRLEAGQDKAQAQRDAARASHDETRLNLALRVVSTWGEWQSAQGRKQALDAGLRHHDRLLRQVQRRLEEGQAAASDLGLAEGRMAALRADLSQASLQEAAARERLALLSGQGLAHGALAAQAGPLPVPASDAGAVLQQVQNNSPALMRLQAQVRAQQATVAEMQARLKPELSARLERQQGNFGVAGTSGQTRLFVGVSTQLGPGLSSLSAVAEALQRQESMRADIDAQRLALAEQISADWQQLAAAPARRADLVRAISSASSVLQSWDRQYLSGRKTWQDLMSAAREQVQAHIQLAEFDSANLVASWRLALMAGGPEQLTTQEQKA